MQIALENIRINRVWSPRNYNRNQSTEARVRWTISRPTRRLKLVARDISLSVPISEH